jgi:sugar phosphate isomerase/epimerase
MTDGNTPNDTPDTDQILERLFPLVPEFEDVGVKIALENFDRFTAYDVVGMVRALGDDVAGVCLDTVNCFGAGEGPANVIETLAPYVLNLHIKDYQVRRQPHRLGFVIDGAPVGQGQLDVPALLAQLQPDVSVTLEQWTPLGSDIETTCREEAKRVERASPTSSRCDTLGDTGGYKGVCITALRAGYNARASRRPATRTRDAGDRPG